MTAFGGEEQELILTQNMTVAPSDVHLLVSAMQAMSDMSPGTTQSLTPSVYTPLFF